MTDLERIASALERIADFFDWQRSDQERREQESKANWERIQAEARLRDQVDQAVPQVADPTTEVMNLMGKFLRKQVGDD